MARYALITDNAAPGIQELVPALIIPAVTASGFQQMVFMPLVSRFDVTGAGDDFSKPETSTLAFAALTYGAGPAEVQWDTLAQTLTPVARYVDVIITLPALAGSPFNLQDEVVKEVSRSWAQDTDALFAARHGDAPAGTNFGTNGVALSYDTFLDGQTILFTNKTPHQENFKWVMHPTQTGEVFRDEVMINAALKGSPVLTQGARMDGYLTSVLNTDLYQSTEVVEATGLHSLMFSRDSLGYAFKRISGPGDAPQELLIEPEWNKKSRLLEIMVTYYGAAGSIKGAANNNTWLSDIIS